MGFFATVNVPSRRVVQYRRCAGHSSETIYIEDESVLGEPIDEMPYADVTGLTATSGGMLYEVAYKPDAGPVYFETQPADTELVDGSAKLTVAARAGKAPYSFQWFQNGVRVVNVPDVAGELVVDAPGVYFVQVTDADGATCVSSAATIKEKGE